MGVLDRHLVHAFEVGHGDIEEGEGRRRAFEARVGFARAGAFPVGQHGLEALPVGERPQRGVRRDQIVQVGCAGPGEAADDDRRLDALVQDLGVPAHEVLDQEAVLQQPYQERVLLEHAGAVEAAFFSHGAAEDLEPLGEFRRAEVMQPGLGRRGIHERLWLEREVPAGFLHEVEDGAGVLGVSRLGQVVDPDPRRAPGVPRGGVHTVSTGSTSTWGCSGVSAGRNQRNQMRPLRWPAVDTQLGWAGRRADTTMMNDPSLS